MKTKTHAADYYRRMLSVQPHALKRLDEFATIVKCHRDHEIPSNSRPAGHWYRWCGPGAARSARTQIVDLMLPLDFFFVSDSNGEDTIEAIADETVLASFPGGRVELLADGDREFARGIVMQV
jgi:CRP/FNR family nitrogen fixation transcriptional regulator